MEDGSRQLQNIPENIEVEASTCQEGEFQVKKGDDPWLVHSKWLEDKLQVN